MSWTEKRTVKVAILDLYEGAANQGMRCIRNILIEWAEKNDLLLYAKEYDVRLKNELPDTSYDVYISSGGPGSPLETRYEDWDIAWCRWLDKMERWNNNPSNTQKKYIFFICHSFQLASRFFNVGLVCKRRSTSFGVFPVHMLENGADEPVFDGLKDPFYAVDSRDYQVIQPNHDLLNEMGASLLCIEKSRPHVPYERAVMGLRFNEYMIGTQFHPEADAPGMSLYLQREDKRKTVIENHGEAKLQSMLEHLEDPDKIVWTYSHILPNFLNHSIEKLHGELV
ncbi:MAG: GMP synthase [Chitinophagaceae bacterium]|mgnify:FL=1|nr:GMP synthase [Chitinophagaceae bacterium]HQV61330.1 GMP synthase [Chitinophagaceae bacterium]HQV84703.1 GMP synthase [Chitinophagaceae bacterium]HQX71712.1 GMP synthase [Chitinophagaceae bacterium]HQZ74517.1 GMP synthase [Chitinophagaceae bacterium]